MLSIKKIHIKKAALFLIQVIVFLIVIWGVSKWQAKDLLPEKTVAPDFTLSSLNNIEYSLSTEKGKKVVLYFFSPWCTMCKLSSHNIVSLREKKSKNEMTIYAVALSWDRIQEVEEFAKNHNLTVPVLLGGMDITDKYKIQSFPTIYIINSKGIIESRMIGYTTEIGLRLRAL